MFEKTGDSRDLSFNSCPALFLLPTHLSALEVTNITEALKSHDAKLADSFEDAGLVLTSARSERRIDAEYQRLVAASQRAKRLSSSSFQNLLPRKRLRTSLAKNEEIMQSVEDLGNRDERPSDCWTEPVPLVQLTWVKDCIEAKKLLPIMEYTLRADIHGKLDDYNSQSQNEIKTEGSVSTISDSGRSTDEEVDTQASQNVSKSSQPRVIPVEKVLLEKSDRLREQMVRGNPQASFRHSRGRRFGWQQNRGSEYRERPRELLRRSTESFEEEESVKIPEPPLWVKQRKIYACERSTPRDGPNKHFIAQLEKIKEARMLLGDEIGVRAYCTSIAAIAAYPFPIHSAKEISALPGCDYKLVQLFIKWKKTGQLTEAQEHDNNEVLQILKTFYDIWGIGATTARDFYFNKGWRDLDDIVEYGWNSLTRVQQIGLKYYDDFLIKVPRDEVEQIGAIIHDHANRVRPGAKSMICGGYRRGNPESGDIDILISHKDEEQTLDMVVDIVKSLEDAGLVTHVLKLATTNSKRSQQPVAIRQIREGIQQGFDTLDKALLVWKSGTDEDTPRRRLDIIISPWKTVGCALLGWSGGNTFQRDVRRFAKRKKNWRFDSSGIRDRATGKFQELEGPKGVSGDMIDAEKTVFRGLGLEYKEPWERCTG